ncbi:MAG: TonB-dependent receptor, partial [Bacteroidales bacterium]|nr:TonB-dependent receptor [Bacteroidales bacterium]
LAGSYLYGQSGPNPGDPNPESKGLITGTVVEEFSEVPMEYTSIAVYRTADSSLVTGTVTNTNGQFRLEDVPYGTYYVEIKFVGYQKSVHSPVVVSRNNRIVDLGEMTLSISSETLAEVEILADQRRVEYKIDKKVVNVSEDLSAAGGTAVDVLENTPSVSVDIEGNVSVRGSGNFTVLINGKPTVLDAADALRQIPASTIRNIEIITNPSVKYDPDGNGGIINVVLKKQNEKGTTGIVNASVGLNNKYRFDGLLNRRTGKMNYFIGGSYNDNVYEGSMIREQTEFLDNGVEEHNDATGNFDFIRGGYQLKAGMDYDVSPKSNLTFEASGGQYTFGMDRSSTTHEYTVPATNDLYFVNTNVMSRNSIYFSGNLNYTQTFDTAAHKLVAMANFSRSTGDGTDMLEYLEANENFEPFKSALSQKNRNVETDNGMEYRLQVDYTKPLANGKFEAGYQARIDDELEDNIFQVFDPDTDQWNAVDENSSEMSFFRNIQGAYVQVAGEFRKIQYQAGMRGEYTHRLIEYENYNTAYEINRFDYYPTLHLARQFINDHQVMLSYSKRVNRPRSYFLDSVASYIDPQTIRIGNPGLEPEYVNSFELGYQKGWDKNLLAFEAYYRNTSNLITRVTDYDSDAGIFYQRFTNINEDHVAGSEVMANWQFAKWFNLNASTNVYYYRIMGYLNGQEVDNSNVSWNANANTTFTVTPTSRIQANLGYHGPTVTAQGSAEGMYYINLAVRQDFFKRKLSATLQVRDLMGSMKREFTASGNGFTQYVLMQREPRVVMLTLSYRINNYRTEQRSDRQESGGGMDMDSGF